MRQKASLLAAALGNLDPVRQTAAPPTQERSLKETRTMPRPTRLLQRNEPLAGREPLGGRTPEGLGKFHQPRKGKYQPEPAVQELTGLAEGQSD